MTSTATPRIRSTRLIVGLEIHVELATRSKMFSRAPNPACPEFQDAEPNTLVDPVVAGLPGALPVMNRRAVEMSAMVGMALGCEIARTSRWDRKNYFYPDLPKGYQISQYDLPLCGDGAMDIPAAAGGTTRIGIIRAHLEEDTGKLGHELPGGHRYEGSLVDLNRAGTPLLEIVTAPDFTCADDVVTFAQELRNLCRFLGVTEGVMQRGHMRFEPNINLVIDTEDGREFRTPVVEVKNLNSFRALRGAIEHEAKRQADAWLSDGKVMGPGAKTTRGWDDQKLVTVLQRENEDAHDYRYFPEPDLVEVSIDDAWLEAIRAELPELPIARRARYVETFGIPEKDAHVLVGDRDLCRFFEDCQREGEAMGLSARDAGHDAAKMLLNAGAKRSNEANVAIHELGIAPKRVAQLVRMRSEGSIDAQGADLLFGELCEADRDAAELAAERGLVKVRDDAAMDRWIDEAIAANAAAAEDVRSGKQAAIGRLVGHVMKASGGQADAKEARERLLARLGGAS